MLIASYCIVLRLFVYCGLWRLVAAYCGLLRIFAACYGALWLIAANRFSGQGGAPDFLFIAVYCGLLRFMAVYCTSSAID